MFLNSFGLVFLAISLCVPQASPAPQPCGDVSTTTSPPSPGNGGDSTATTAKGASPSASAPATTPTTRTAANPSANTSSGVQASLTLDSKVISPAFANDGQTPPTPGQVPSLTSTNNFINFCANFPNISLTNGQQLPDGSCNPAPMGLIPSTKNMPSSKFKSPTNFANVKANQTFTIQMAIINLETGNFTNSNTSYFAAPQQLNSKGAIIGHSHIVIQKIPSFNSTTPIDPNDFVFFLAVNNAAEDGILKGEVADGLDVGTYKLSSITTAANHQPVLVPVARHGAIDDAVYFNVVADGTDSSKALAAVNSQKSEPPVSSTSSSTPTSTTSTSSTSMAY